jgi:MFS family permease
MPWFLAASIFGVTAGSLFYAAIDVDTPVSHIYGFSVLLALGAGLSQQAAYSVAPTEVPPHRVPDAVGFINMAQIGSSVIALTITSSIFQNVGFRHVSAALAGLGYSADEMHVALTGQRSAIFVQVSDEVRQQLVKAIVKTVNDEYILVIAAGAIGTIVALLMNRGKLNLEAAVGG